MNSLDFERAWLVMLLLASSLPFVVGYFARHRVRVSIRTGLLLVTLAALAVTFVKPELDNFEIVSVWESLRQGRAVTRTGLTINHPDLTFLLVVLVSSSSFAWALHAHHLEKLRDD